MTARASLGLDQGRVGSSTSLWVRVWDSTLVTVTAASPAKVFSSCGTEVFRSPAAVLHARIGTMSSSGRAARRRGAIVTGFPSDTPRSHLGHTQGRSRATHGPSVYILLSNPEAYTLRIRLISKYNPNSALKPSHLP